MQKLKMGIIIGFALIFGAAFSCAASENVTYNACISQTGSEPEYKDCCDCMDGDANDRKEWMLF